MAGRRRVRRSSSQADVDKSAEEGAGSQDHIVGMEAQSHLGHYAANLILLDDQVVAGLLEYPQVPAGFPVYGG